MTILCHMGGWRWRLMRLSSWTCYSCHAWLSPNSMSHYWCWNPVLQRCSRPRGEGADGKTKRLALLTPDKLTSDGASCSASGACWAEQLSVEWRTERGKPQVYKQRHKQTSNQSCTAFDACSLFNSAEETFVETSVMFTFTQYLFGDKHTSLWKHLWLILQTTWSLELIFTAMRHWWRYSWYPVCILYYK